MEQGDSGWRYVFGTEKREIRRNEGMKLFKMKERWMTESERITEGQKDKKRQREK